MMIYEERCIAATTNIPKMQQEMSKPMIPSTESFFNAIKRFVKTSYISGSRSFHKPGRLVHVYRFLNSTIEKAFLTSN